MAACCWEHPVTLVLAQVRPGGEQGIGWTYGSPACAAVISGVLAGVVTRLVNAISALDVARGTLRRSGSRPSAHRLLGVRRDNVPVYCSGGFTCYDDDQLRDQLSGWSSGQRISRRSGSWTPPPGLRLVRRARFPPTT